MRLEYKPHKKGPRKAPASAPQLMDMSCAMNVIDELYCTSAMTAEMATNATSRQRIHASWRFSSMLFTTLSFSRSSVSVLDEVSTSELKVDIEAESTSTITRPTSRLGKVESIVGMMES